MGQAASCSAAGEERSVLVRAASVGDLKTLKAALEEDPYPNPSLLDRTTTLFDRQSLLHVASSSGQIDVLSWLLDHSMNPDVMNRRKQTPLMLAAKHGEIACVQKLICAGANVLMFDSKYGRTCLHYAAYHGHSDCLQFILSVARTSHVAVSWGYARFVNIRDDKGATPLHLAARKRQPDCLHILLDNGALVSASTGTYGHPGSTALHLAARRGSLDCIRELLAWGSDRLQRDCSGRIAYGVALRHKHGACAALLNPSSAEPLVWPSPLKFISELNPEAKLLLEQALMEANREREKAILKGAGEYSVASPCHSDSLSDDNISEGSDTDLCCICFDQVCMIQVQDCGHRMCAHCTLALCCHNKPNPATSALNAPVCPFCRSKIAHLVVAKTRVEDENIDEIDNKLKRSRRFQLNANDHSGSSGSFKSISSFGKLSGGRAGGSGRVMADNELMDKAEP